MLLREAAKLLRDDDTAIGGRMPVKPSGGPRLLAEAVPAPAIAQVSEIIWQLRGQARDGITTNKGLLGHSSSVLPLRR